MRHPLNKHKFLRVVSYNSDKSSRTTYYKREQAPKDLLINPDHIFNWNGYSTIVITDKARESINPLDFESKFDAKMFTSAINSKIVSETFATLKTNKIDMQQILIFALLFINLIMLYFILKQGGVI